MCSGRLHPVSLLFVVHGRFTFVLYIALVVNVLVWPLSPLTNAILLAGQWHNLLIMVRLEATAEFVQPPAPAALFPTPCAPTRTPTRIALCMGEHFRGHFTMMDTSSPHHSLLSLSTLGLVVIVCDAARTSS